MGKRPTSVLHLRAGKALGRKTPKYRNIKVTYDGRTFDSKAELKRYQDLCLLQKANKIFELKCQHPIKLMCGGKTVMQRSARYWKNGRQVHYICDFRYWDTSRTPNQYVYEDVKGKDTPLSALKRAVVETEYGIRIEIVR